MSNSCHMQYGHALRWAWGCLMRSSLILEERGREHEGAERDLNHKQNSSGWLWANLSVYLSRQQHFYFHYFLRACICACMFIVASLDSSINFSLPHIECKNT